MERQKCEQWKCGIVSSDLCAKETLIRTQLVVKREMNFYTVVSKKARMVIVNIVKTYMCGLQSWLHSHTLSTKFTKKYNTCMLWWNPDFLSLHCCNILTTQCGSMILTKISQRLKILEFHHIIFSSSCMRFWFQFCSLSVFSWRNAALSKPWHFLVFYLTVSNLVVCTLPNPWILCKA